MFAVEVCDDEVRRWSRRGDEAVVERDYEYRPACFVGGPAAPLAELRDRLADDPKVASVCRERWQTTLRADAPDTVLRVTLERASEVRTLAREVRCLHERQWSPGTFRLYSVDLSPKFRYCLATGTTPVPETDLRTLSLSLPERALADERVDALACDGDPLASGDGPGATLRALARRLDERDPDVLVLSSGELVPLVHERADELGVDCHLGRLAGYRRLAGASTYESYGQVGHSPARYDVPGRVLIDRSNSFLWDEGGLAGLLDLAERSGKPLQELGWASIGSALTAIQIRAAREQGVLVPWRAWEPEAFTSAATLHDADRGGFTFEPDVGIHTDVVEVDFASLYPSIMCEYNLSPETVRCDCHDRSDVPGLGYSVCDDDGFVPGVLAPLIEDRAAYKQRRDESDDPAECERLQARIDTLKWLLVTCFGYQGFANSKFGRIECHEAINAYAREILLDAKEHLEESGWRVLHGIVDSLWVRKRSHGERFRTSERRTESEATPIEEVVETVSDAVGIPLEHEADFEWVAFVPRRDGRGGALNRYFGRTSEGEYKFRGIECRQRSTPPFVASVQRALIETLDEQIRASGVDGVSPEAVCDRLQRALARLRGGGVPTDDLVVETRASRSLADYDQRTRTVAALEQYAAAGIERHPGQAVEYVVTDDDRSDRERVALPWNADGYDADFYETLLVRACESVVSPLGWDRGRIRQYLADGRDLRLSAFE